LAELVGASTSTAATQGPMSFPQRHPLCGPGASTAYDYTLGLEAQGAQASIVAPGLATLVARDPGNIGFGGIAPVPGRVQPTAGGRALQADAEASLPLIIEEVRRQMTADRQRLVHERAAKHAAANQQARIDALQQALEQK